MLGMRRVCSEVCIVMGRLVKGVLLMVKTKGIGAGDDGLVRGAVGIRQAGGVVVKVGCKTRAGQADPVVHRNRGEE